MNDFITSELKSILHSKRANLYYLEHCRVMQKDGRVVYLTEEKKQYSYWNIPIANTTFILLGTGTSITQAAVRLLASAGVMIGFCGGGGTPLLMGTDVEWMTPQSEYRPTEYLQGWLSFWFSESKRFQVAKEFQHKRLTFVTNVWSKDKDFIVEGFSNSSELISSLLSRYLSKIDAADNVSQLLQSEALLTKELYKLAVITTKYGNFTRDRNGEDLANIFLNHGNYLAYGLAATALWVLGIPHGFAVMHGKTRRGALVFDVADLIKDAIILPLSFICAKERAAEQEFRQECLNFFTKHEALDYMFNVVKDAALTNWE